MSVKLILCFLSIILFTSCLKPKADPKAAAFISPDPRKILKIWALSDIQPNDDEQKIEFQNAIRDINKNVPGIDLAIVAGDIINDADEEDFDWYVSTKSLSYVEDWYEIAGNHDLKLDRGEGYKRKIRRDFHYSFSEGNVLFVLMSDEVRGKATEISDAAFEWWKDLVINNQDKIIVVVTHAPLEGSGIPFSGFEDRQIRESERFAEVLKNYKVDMWLSGHLHLSHGLPGNINKVDNYNGTIFINLSGIRTELWGIKDSESRIITFICGSDEALIMSRNHTDRDYTKELDAMFRLSKEYKCK